MSDDNFQVRVEQLMLDGMLFGEAVLSAREEAKHEEAVCVKRKSQRAVISEERENRRLAARAVTERRTERLRNYWLGKSA